MQQVVLDKPDVKGLILDLMKTRTERDAQVKVGASNFSSVCSRCVADALVATTGSGSSPWWMGSWLGTAIHERMEDLAAQHRPAWITEQKLFIGELPGYGTIKSTTDLYVPEHLLGVDYKSTTRAKIKWIKDALTTDESDYEITSVSEARFKVQGYRNQLHSYGRALVMAGYPVEWVSLVFVCRDGTGDADVWPWTEAYDPDLAEAVWDRVVRLWAWLQEGHTPDELSSHEHCYECNHRKD